MIDDIRHIRAFFAVAKLGNFTRAAGKLHMSQPALTVQIRRLEESLGVRLFDRTKRQVALTQVGRDLMKPLEQVLADLDMVEKTSQDMKSVRRGRVKIAALPSLSAGLIPLTIRHFTAKHPDIDVHLNDVLAEKVLQLVKAEEVDFGIGSRLGPDRDIEVTALLTDRLCALFPEDHALAKRRFLALRDIVAFPLILMAEGSSVRTFLENILERQKLEFSLVCQSNYMSTAVGLVRAGLGVCILPESVINVAVCDGVSVKPITTPKMVRSIDIIRKRNRSLSPAAQQFVESLKETARLPIAHFTKPSEGGALVPHSTTSRTIKVGNHEISYERLQKKGI
jgi:DNA-binding transcriptional LysR family regulator